MFILKGKLAWCDKFVRESMKIFYKYINLTFAFLFASIYSHTVCSCCCIGENTTKEFVIFI